jgi:hypothetical protein
MTPKAGQLIIVAARQARHRPNRSALRLSRRSSPKSTKATGLPPAARRQQNQIGVTIAQDHHSDQQPPPKQRKNDLARQPMHVGGRVSPGQITAAAPIAAAASTTCSECISGEVPPCVDHLSCVDHLCVTTVAVGGDAFARHLTEHPASAPGAVSLRLTRSPMCATCQGARSSDWNTALRCLAVGACGLHTDSHRAGRHMIPHAR